MGTLLRPFALVTIVLLLGTAARAASPPPPFVVTASSGPAAGAHVRATVTRVVDGTSVTLPAALVPALVPGDVVDASFPDYQRPPNVVRYHVNVAFITESAPQHWLFPRSGPRDRLFSTGPSRARATPPAGTIHFVYGTGDARGIPIFTIVPEDAKTRGVDGVRDYVDAHPTDFVDMAQSTNDAVEKYSFLDDFMTSLAAGSIDPASSQYRIESVAQSFGVSPTTIDACYTSYTAQADINNCVQQAIDGVTFQTNFTAPTQAEFLGGVVGAAEPIAYAPYIGALLTVWKLFVHTGHLEYEYLPTTIQLADPTAQRTDELLMGLKVPTIRPPGAYSDVLFFTIGDPKVTEHAPAVIDDAPATGACAATNRFSVPLHLDHTSPYVHATQLVVTPDGRAPYTIPLDPRALVAPVVDRARLTGSTDGGYTISLAGRFGFDPIVQPVNPALRLAVPADAPWTIAPAPHRVPVAGGSLDLVASAASAACLSHAEVQIGSLPPIDLTATHLDDRDVALHASLANVPAGPAELRIDEADARDRRTIETTYPLTIQAPPAQVDLKSAAVALGDAFVHLAGSGLEHIRAVTLNGATYAKEATSTATSACFDGPPLGASGLAAGAQLTAQLVPGDGSAGEVFPLTIDAARPVLAHATFGGVAAAVHRSSAIVPLSLDTGGRPLPRQIAVRLRPATATPQSVCASLQPDAAAVTVPAADVHVRGIDRVAVDLQANVLHDRAFGTLEVQLVDGATGLGSAWLPLPGTFARAPMVTQIQCPADAGAPCRMYGTDLASIDAVLDATGAFAPPNPNCPPTDKGEACVYVPQVAHYTLRLVDGGTTETLPDGLVARAPAPKS
jgi:hypothetical protein